MSEQYCPDIFIAQEVHNAAISVEKENLKKIAKGY